MSWLKVLRPPRKLEPDPRLRWFGKLPTYGDYYKSSAGESWALEFEQWVLQGYESYRSRLGEVAPGARRLPPTGVALRLPATRMTVVAAVLDYGGDNIGRPFPLCFYAAVPTERWPGPGSATASGLMRLLGKLTGLRDRVVRFVNAPGRFESIFGGREVDLSELEEGPADSSWREAAGTVRLRDWFEVVGQGTLLKDLPTWAAAVVAWGRRLAALDSEQDGPTVRFPLAMGIHVEAQVAGWLRWLERRYPLDRQPSSALVSMDPAAALGSLTVIARELTIGDFLLLTALSSSVAYLDDLRTVKPAEGQPGPLGSAPDTWAEFVESE